MAFDLRHFSGADAVRLSTDLRRLGATAPDLEQVAQRTAHLLYTSLVDGGTTEPACALVRFYVLTRYGALDEERRRFAIHRGGGEPVLDSTPCLSLFGTSGLEPAWNSPSSSARHLAIPLPSNEHLQHFPMIRALFSELGVNVGLLFRANQDIGVSLMEGQVGVFYVPEARGSAAIPGHSFVETYGIRSVLGFGGTLPAGEMFVVLLFSKVPVDHQVSEHCKTVALGTKLASLRVVLCRGSSAAGLDPGTQLVLQQERIATMERLLDDQEQLATTQAERVATLVEELNFQLAAEREKAESLAQMHLTIAALSTPIIEVWDDILVMPLVGGIDSRRAAQIMDRLLGEVSSRGCRFVILDVTGVDTIDTAIADSLIGIIRAVELLGAECVLTGMKPSVSQTLVTLGVDLGKLRTLRNLKHALKAFLGTKPR